MSRFPKVTGRRTWPIGTVEPSVTPEKGLVGWSYSYGTWRLSNVSTDRMLSHAPPSIRVLVTCTLLMTGAQHWEDVGSGCALELIHRVESDGALGPPERACGLELGEDCIHFTGKLLEDTLRGWGLCSAQDASDSTRLLEAPSPLILVMVFIPPWLWW